MFCVEGLAHSDDALKPTFGTTISNRAPLLKTPRYRIDIPVRSRISRDMKSPYPVCLPYSWLNMTAFSTSGIPQPSANHFQVMILLADIDK